MDTEQIVNMVVEKIRNGAIPVEISARHVHLSKEHVEALFGPGQTLLPKRPLSQPGQFLSQQRVRLTGPKGILDNVAVLGPERNRTQVELSLTDCRGLGVQAPLRESGHIDGSGGIAIWNQERSVVIGEGVIIAKSHIHMTTDDANRLNLKNSEIVGVRLCTQRPVVLDGVVVRISDGYRLAMHIDFDEANASMFSEGSFGIILKKP